MRQEQVDRLFGQLRQAELQVEELGQKLVDSRREVADLQDQVHQLRAALREAERPTLHG